MELYVDFWLNRSIHTQFEAFAKGFLMLCGGPALQVGGSWAGPAGAHAGADASLHVLLLGEPMFTWMHRSAAV